MNCDPQGLALLAFAFFMFGLAAGRLVWGRP